MRKVLLTLCLISSLTLFAPDTAQAQKVPDKIQNYVAKVFPKTNFRFDGVIILPDNTIYLPLFPAALDEIEELEIKSTIPAGKTLAQKPDVVIFNNDFVLLRVIDEKDGSRTIAKMETPPNEVLTGLLPQDMLIPKGLIIPQNLRIIAGNLDITMAQQDDLKTAVRKTTSDNTAFKALSVIPELKNKTLYIATCYNKNIQVVNQENRTPDYALSQKYIPITIKGTPDGKFLLVSSYDKKTIDVISLVDDQVIKRIEFSSQPDEIIIDRTNNIAYVSSPLAHSIFVVNLKNIQFFGAHFNLLGLKI